MENDKDSNKSKNFAHSAIPRGIEVLVKKASVDPEFRKLLLDKRAEAAMEIDLQLDKNEADMLAAIPREQLEKIINNTNVSPEHKKIFLGSIGVIMLALIVGGVMFENNAPSRGHTLTTEEKERIQQMQLKKLADSNDISSVNIDQNTPPVSRGISPDRIIREDLLWLI